MPTERRPNITIYQVAAEAGVAISTVSKVLSHKSGISAVTRKKVEEAVERLGYIPSLAARGLTGGQTGIIGLIFAFTPDRLFNDPYLLQNLLGIEQALNELDYNLLISTGQPDDLGSSFDRLLRSRYFDGVVVMETNEINKLALHLKIKDQNLPWVMMGYPGEIHPCYAVYADDLTGGQKVGEHLLSLGHTRFAVVNTTTRPSGVDERVRGFLHALAKKGLTIPPDRFYYGDFTLESGFQVAPAIFQQPDFPTAIFSVNDRMALGIMNWAQENGLRVGEDFSIVGFDDIAAACQSLPPLTTVRQPGIEIGRRAVNVVHRLILGEHPAHQTVLDTQLIVRGTTGRVKSRS